MSNNSNNSNEQPQRNARGIPTELEDVFAALKFGAKKYEILGDSDTDDVDDRTVVEVPAVGSFWRGSVDERSYRVVAIASDREVRGGHGMATFTNPSGFDGAQVEQMKTEVRINAQTKVVFQEAETGDVFTMKPSEFFSDVALLVADDDQQPSKGPRFVAEDQKPNEWKWWWPLLQKVQNWKRKRWVAPLDFEAVKADLASSSTKPLYVINTMITKHGMADLIFLAYPQASTEIDTSNPKSQPPTIVKIPATWYPFDLTAVVTRAQLRTNSAFLNLLNTGHLTIIDSKRARQFMNTEVAIAERKRVDERQAFIKNTGKARTVSY